MELIRTDVYRQLLDQISDAYTQGQVRAVQAVNTQLIETYWQIGRHIVEYEQSGNVRAEYGKALINNLAADLGLRHGKGFSRSNLVYMRLLYQRYPISQKPSHQLSWSHYVELLKLDDELERGDIVIFRPNSASAMFLGYLCNTSPINAQKASRGQGDAVVHISASALSGVEMTIPGVDEQAVIATVLSDMDAELSALVARRDKTRDLKQAMMQELLTGRTRLV